MDKPTEAYPLAWPVGWRRTSPELRTRAPFGKSQFVQTGIDPATQQRRGYNSKVQLTIDGGTRRVLETLERMGFNKSVIVSTDLVLRQDGLPRSGQRQPADTGVAVYWGSGKTARCMAVDRYDRVADNLAAIAATLEAMRLIERHGGAEIIARAFTGFTALPAPEQPWQVLGLGANPTREQVDEAYRRLAAKHHPDRPGGNAQEMVRINTARDALLGEAR